MHTPRVNKLDTTGINGIREHDVVKYLHLWQEKKVNRAEKGNGSNGQLAWA